MVFKSQGKGNHKRTTCLKESSSLSLRARTDGGKETPPEQTPEQRSNNQPNKKRKTTTTTATYNPRPTTTTTSYSESSEEDSVNKDTSHSNDDYNSTYPLIRQV